MTQATVITATRSVAHYLSPLQLVGDLWRYRGLIRQLTWRQVLTRYRGSALGVLWAILLQVAQLAVYTFVFGVVFNARRGQAGDTGFQADYAIWLYCGLVLFQVFADCLTQSPSCILWNPSYVKKVVFPLEVMPVVLLGSALVNALIGLGLILLAEVAFLHTLPPYGLTIFIVALPLVMLSLGVGWFLSSLGVFLRDIAQVVTLLSTILMFMTPIFYSLLNVPPMFRTPMQLNPLTIVIENSRRALLPADLAPGRQPAPVAAASSPVAHGWLANGAHEWLAPDWPWLIAVTLFSAVVMQLGYAWFMKTKRGFADVV